MKWPQKLVKMIDYVSMKWLIISIEQMPVSDLDAVNIWVPMKIKYQQTEVSHINTYMLVLTLNAYL